MNNKPSVLVVDDDVSFAKAIVRKLHGLDYQASFACDGKQALALLEHKRFDSVLTDLMMPEIDGLELMRRVRKKHKQDFCVMTAQGTLDSAISALQLGARDFLVKPFPMERLGMLFAPSDDSELTRQSDEWRRTNAPEIFGTDPGLLTMLHMVRRVADTMCSVLVLGETGTGKELVARALHRSSGRSGAFIPVNCAAIPRDLIESELFGHAKGAFTGAHSDRLGRFAAAEGGTLFLDEIGEMSLEAQAKILRVLQEHEYTPVGGTALVGSDVRIVAATNRSLKDEVTAQRFREDLYFRLNVVTLRLPPLRDRAADIPLLLAHALERVNHSAHRNVTGFSAEALQALCAYRWPGNVRELENAVERLVVSRGSGEIGLDDVKDIIGQRPGPEARAKDDFVLPPALSETGIDLKASLEAFEDDMVAQAMVLASGNQSRAAGLLKINRTTLIEKLRRQRQRQQQS